MKLFKSVLLIAVLLATSSKAYSTNSCNGHYEVKNCVVSSFDQGGHSLWLPGLNGISSDFHFDAVGGKFQEFANGKARLSGYVTNEDDPTQSWYVSIWLSGKMNWDDWSAAGRDYKDEQNIVTNEHKDWDYYILDPVKVSRLTGKGSLSGSILNLTHMPSNYQFGFQIGTKANSKNANYGMACWFYYNGKVDGQTVSGHGDVNVNSACSPGVSFNVPDTITCHSPNVNIEAISGNGNSFSWTGPAGFSSTLSAPAVSKPGWYHVTVTSAAGCESYGKTRVIQRKQKPKFKRTIIEPTCNGDTDGSISINVTTPTGPHTYAWSTGESTASLSNLGKGTYVVTVTGVNGCSASKSMRVRDLNFSVKIAATMPSCAGSNDATASAKVRNGTAPYTYEWSTGETTESISGLAPGFYSLTVTDANGCTTTHSRKIRDGKPLKVVYASTQPTCESPYGSAQAVVHPYHVKRVISYEWNTGQSTSSLDSLAPGNYSVTITYDNGCTISEDFTLNAIPCCNVTDAGEIGNAQQNCGSFDPMPISSISLPSGGIGSIEYVWLERQPGQAFSIISGANGPTYDPGNISTTMEYRRCSRRSGCSVYIGESNWITMEVLDAPNVTVTSMNGDCTNGNMGTATAIGGSSYLWSNGATTASIVGLDAGTYTVTATDANGCTDVASVNIEVEGCCNVTSAGEIGEYQSGCGAFDPDTIYSVSLPGGGVGQLEYVWLQRHPEGSASIIQGANGPSYDPGLITETTEYRRCARRSGCIAYIGESNWVTVEVLNQPEISISSTAGNCNNGNLGSAEVIVSNSNTYSIDWSNGSNTATIGSLTNGTYSVSVTDESGCVVSGSVQIANENCNGNACSGFRTQTQGGWGTNPNGNNPGVYLHSHFHNAFPNGLTIGCNNTLILTNAASVSEFLPSGSTAQALPSGQLINPGSSYNNVLAGQLVAAKLNVGFDQYDQNFGASNQHSGGLIYTSGTFSGMTVSMVIQIADDYIGGCAASYTASELNTALTAFNESYVDGTGNGAGFECPAVCDNVTSAGEIGNAQQNCGGFDPDPITSLSLPSGGTGMLEYVWLEREPGQSYSVIAGANGPTFDPGYISTTMEYRRCARRNGCSAYLGESNWVTITVDEECVNPPTASNCTGGNFQWENDIDATNLSGSYGIPYAALRMKGGGVTEYLIPGPYPSEFNSSVVVNIDEAISWDAYLSRASTGNQPKEQWRLVFRKNGNTVYTSDYTGDLETGVTADEWIGSLGSGIFLPNGADEIIIAHYEDPTYGTGSASSANSVVPVSVCISFESGCDNVTDGGAIGNAQSSCGSFDPQAITNVAAPSGGTGGLNYQWQKRLPGQPYSVIAGATAATYDPGMISQTMEYRRVSKRNDCIDYVGESNWITMTVNQPVIAIAGSNNPLCAGDEAIVMASASGGQAPYSYAWSNGIMDATFATTTAGTYTVTITDAFGCFDVSSATVVMPDPIIVETSTMNPECSGDIGTITASITGGVAPFTYAWSNGGSSESMTSSTTGVYIVTVTDANGCSGSAIGNLIAPTPVVAVMSGTAESGFFANDGTATVTPSGGTPGYTYLWDNGGTTQSITGLAGYITYSVTVTDFNGCIATGSYYVDGGFSGKMGQIDGSELNENSISSINFLTYPNPVQSNGNLSIEVSNVVESTTLQLELYSLAGHLIQTDEFGLTEGDNTIQTRLIGSIASGQYLVILRAGETSSKQIIQVLR